MKNIFIVRHSAVVPSDYSKPKDWREVTFFKWSKAHFEQAELLISSFDHYALKQRNKLDFEGSEDVVVLKTPGYKKTVSILRVIDAWVFGFKILIYALKRVQKSDVVVVSLPTPESAFCLSIARLFKRYTLIVDVRDNWPDNFTGQGMVKKTFSTYVRGLNHITFKVADKFIWMSDGLHANHKAKGLSKRSDAEEITIPVPLPRFLPTLTETTELDYLFEKPALAFFGTLNPQFDLSILKSHIDCSPSSYEFNYIIAGSGEKLTFLKKIFSGYDNVFFLGQIPFEKTQIISRRCSGFFLYYREPETYANHITNKFREYAEHRKPILHNLISSNFTIGEKAYQIGCSCHDFSFEEALVDIKTATFSKIFAIESLERLANDLSWDALERQFISTLED